MHIYVLSSQVCTIAPSFFKASSMHHSFFEGQHLVFDSADLFPSDFISQKIAADSYLLIMFDFFQNYLFQMLVSIFPHNCN